MTSPEPQQQQEPQLPAASRVLVNPNFRRRDRVVGGQPNAAMKRHSVHISNLSQQIPTGAPSAAHHRNRHSVHINPKLQAALQLPDGGSGRIVINPKFQQSEKPSSQSSGTVHINPNFRASPPAREEISNHLNA